MCDYPGRVRNAALVAAAVAALSACGDRRQAAPEIPIAQFDLQAGRVATAGNATIGGAARAALDSANGLFRAKRYLDALAQYRLAASQAPEDPAPYFGIYMVAGATGNRKLGDTAQAALRARGMTPPEGPHVRTDSARK